MYRYKIYMMESIYTIPRYQSVAYAKGRQNLVCRPFVIS